MTTRLTATRSLAASAAAAATLLLGACAGTYTVGPTPTTTTRADTARGVTAPAPVGPRTWYYYPAADMYYCPDAGVTWYYSDGDWVATHDEVAVPRGERVRIDHKGHSPYARHAEHRRRHARRHTPRRTPVSRHGKGHGHDRHDARHDRGRHRGHGHDRDRSRGAEGHVWVYYPASQAFVCTRHNCCYVRRRGRWVRVEDRSSVRLRGPKRSVSYAGATPHLHVDIRIDLD